MLAHARIVTVTGYGGVGKTRLALRAADKSAFRYPDGVVLVDLASARDPALLLPAVTAALRLDPPTARRGGARQDGHRAGEGLDQATHLDAVLNDLRRRRLLLIWDTCEHMIEPCARLAELVLRNAAGVTILATSRQPLDVPGEYIISVPPLPVPGIVAGADSGSAVELLAQQAASVLPGFTVTSRNRAAVIALCHRLDGIPLAIELAAIRLRALPLEELTAMPQHGCSPGFCARAWPVTRRSSSRSNGAGPSALPPSAPCGRAWRCSPGALTSRPPKPCAAAT